MTKYFAGVRTAEDLKATYHKWCKALHPDKCSEKGERKMNRYTYEVIKCNGIPLHFVYEEVAGCYDTDGNKLWIKTEYLKNLTPVDDPDEAEHRNWIKGKLKQLFRDYGCAV